MPIRCPQNATVIDSCDFASLTYEVDSATVRPPVDCASVLHALMSLNMKASPDCPVALFGQLKQAEQMKVYTVAHQWGNVLTTIGG